MFLLAVTFRALPVAGCASCESAGPDQPNDQPAWLAALKAERDSVLKKVNFTGGVFGTPELAWTQTNYLQPQMHPYDRFFYDPTVGYTVDKYLDDLTTRYGGVDSILMWPTYTNIGSDDRNQFDYFRAMPGGLDGVRNVTLQLKARGVRVLWPYNPWDHGTHREPLSDEQTFAKLLKRTNGDGFNGDTMEFVPESFYEAALNVNYPIAFEPEGGGTDEALNWATMGWGYWDYPTVAGVARDKFLTSGKFMTNICNRWATDKTNDLQSAWFNGAGYETWENVWGTWNGITPRDAEAIRRVGAMSRFFGGKVDSTSFPTPKRDFLHSPDWEPHYTGLMQSDVYSSKFPLGDGSVANLYTVINRKKNKNFTAASDGQMLWLEGPLPADAVVYDCYRGVELNAEAPKPAPPAPTPAPTPAGYNLYGGWNCFNGHGGTEIDTDPVKHLTVAQCTARCDADAKCSCVTMGDPADAGTKGDCWRRANCEPAEFSGASGQFDVYVKAKGYKLWGGFNSYNGHGGSEIDNNPVILSVPQCKARCDADAKCSCVTYEASSKSCWKRASCVPMKFEKGAYDTYVKQSMQPACVRGCGGAGGLVPPPANSVAIAFDLEDKGYGCVLQTTKPIDAELTAFLAKMKQMNTKPLYEYDGTWRYLLQKRVAIPATVLATMAPAGTVHVPKNAAWKFVVNGVEIEGDDGHGVDVQYEWEAHPMREHSKTLAVGPFYIDQYPVTTTNYSTYLKATKYAPTDAYNFLKNWNGSGTTPPDAIKDMPVTYVGLDEARAFCKWRGARLPTEIEWQYSAQGTDGRTYPWGSTKDQSKFPKSTTGTVFNGPESVFAHSQGASPFGVMDLVGNVWQYTDEFQDDHTRGVIVRGGSNYRPSGSMWYFPEALELETHNKYFLMSARYERAGTIGFRCVVDATQ